MGEMGRGRVARVVVDVRPIAEPLDYLTGDLDADVVVGSLVRVPLQGRHVRGWVVGFRDVSEVPEPVRARLRPLSAFVCEIPVSDPPRITLAGRVADHYAGPVATVLSWGTPRPLPRRLRSAASLAPLPARTIPEVTEAISASQRVEAFVRTWPGDDTAGTLGPLVAALPHDRCALVVVPPSHAPRIPGAVDLSAGRDADRTRAWETAVSGSSRLVLSGRHGPFAPIPNLGLVVVSQSHLPWHKDERTPALDARVVARRLARELDLPYVEISPTSPVGPEGLLAASAAEGTRPVSLRVPHCTARWPLVELTDLTDEPTVGPLGSRFFALVRAALAEGGSSLVFLNRRGIARSLVCRQCGKLAACSTCSGRLVPENSELSCARCGARLPFVACPSCGSDKVRMLGIGVTKLRREIHAAFGEVEVVEASGTSAPPPIPGGIVVGTQVALRHRRAFDLVVLVDPDASLSRPGIRGEESALHLLVEAVGAARGSADGGHVLVQTRRRDHPAIRALGMRDCAEYESLVLSEREVSGLPPWRRSVEIRCADDGVLRALANALESAGGEVLGPRHGTDPGLLAFVDTDRWSDALPAMRSIVSEHADVRIRIEVDPLDPR